jgi:hypothetical protein
MYSQIINIYFVALAVLRSRMIVMRPGKDFVMRPASAEIL